LWDDPIVTEITPLSNYSTAEDYHQNYFNNNPNAGYCSVVIAPKLAKFKKDFPHLLQESL
jgi:peptide-methionine (S)-S-oxide reductase